MDNSSVESTNWKVFPLIADSTLPSSFLLQYPEYAVNLRAVLVNRLTAVQEAKSRLSIDKLQKIKQKLASNRLMLLYEAAAVAPFLASSEFLHHINSFHVIRVS